jgi:hypothetical protein
MVLGEKVFDDQQSLRVRDAGVESSDVHSDVHSHVVFAGTSHTADFRDGRLFVMLRVLWFIVPMLSWQAL